MQTFRDAQSPETRPQPTETRKPLRLKIRLPDNLLVPSSVSEPCILQVCLKRNRNLAFAAHLPERGFVTGRNPGGVTTRTDRVPVVGKCAARAMQGFPSLDADITGCLGETYNNDALCHGARLQSEPGHRTESAEANLLSGPCPCYYRQTVGRFDQW